MQLQTYNPARLATAYSPNRPGWPLAVGLLLAIGQVATVKTAAARPVVDWPVRLGARSIAPGVAVEKGVAELPEQQALFEEVNLPAMPKRSYQIKMRVQQIEKGHLRM